MGADDHRTYVYVGLGGEGQVIGTGGLYRRADGDQEWQRVTRGLPPNPQIRALLLHPHDPKIIYAGTQLGPYRSDDRGDHWEALEVPLDGKDVWSLSFHPLDTNVMYAGYEPCAIYRSDNAGVTWSKTNTDSVVFPHITTYTAPLGKRVVEIIADPSNPLDMYAAIEVGGLLASRDGGEHWESIIDGPYLGNNTLDLHGVQVGPAAPGVVYIVTQVGTFRSRDRGRHWEHVQIEEMFPGGTYCRDMLVAPDDPMTMYLAAGAGGGSAPPGTANAGALFRSSDAGESWGRLDLGDVPPSRMWNVAINRTAPSQVYCSSWGGEVYASHDGGGSWSKSNLPETMVRGFHAYSLACG